jgi:alkyldihydroxyacetonephosphate synthase
MSDTTDRVERALTELLGAGSVERSEAGGLTARPDRATAVGELLRLAASEGFAVRTPAGPPARAGKAEVLLRLDRIDGALTLDTTSCTATVPGGLTGADLAWRLHREGYWVQPFAQPFYREPIGTWLAGSNLAGELTALSWWESPLMTVEAILGDGRVLRAGVAPRSAAGPDYRALLLGGGDRVGVITGVAWRIFRRTVPLLFAARLPDEGVAVPLLAEHCGRGWRPWCSWVARGAEPADWRRPATFGGGGETLLLCHRAEGARADLLRRQIGDAVRGAGGEVLEPAEARAWYEGSFLGWCRHGAAAAAEATDEPLDGQVGTAWIAVPWSAMPTLWSRLADPRRKVRAVVSAEGLRPEGGLLKLRLLADGGNYRAGRARYQLARTAASVRGRLVSFVDAEGVSLPPGHRTDPSLQLLEAVADGLGPRRVLNPLTPPAAGDRKGG